MVETVESRSVSPPSSVVPRSKPQRLSDVPAEGFQRIDVPMPEFSRVLGGGIVPGSVVLIAGDPGIGKSTLLLQVGALVSGSLGSVLYVSGEESAPQLKNRAQRLGLSADGVYLLTETDVDLIIEHIHELEALLVVVDSIQTIYVPELDSSAGTISQVRASATRLTEVAKGDGVPVFLVGHVTKEGAIAGPRVLEHMVDTVLYLEGERFHAYRLLRGVKNRFGSTDEVGVFEMRGQGLQLGRKWPVVRRGRVSWGRTWKKGGCRLDKQLGLGGGRAGLERLFQRGEEVGRGWVGEQQGGVGDGGM